MKLDYDIGQKDHILGMALFPLTLAQILITKRVDFNFWLKLSVLLIGGTLILLKPHYGVIPLVIFIHRAVSQKRLTVIFDVDFICLAICFSSYISLIFLAFPDFISIILPSIFQYYASDISPHVYMLGVQLIIQFVIPAILCAVLFKNGHSLITCLSLMAAICVIPIILQGKGWAYHAIPAEIFFYSSVSILAVHLIERSFILLKEEKLSRYGALIIPVMLLLFVVSTKYENTPSIPTHDSYKNTELAQTIKACGSDCSFLIMHDMINMSPELSVYTSSRHASRFPTFWFIPSFLNIQNNLNSGQESSMTQTELDQEVLKYTNMIAEDFSKNDPDIVFVGLFPNFFDNGQPFNFYDYLLSKNPNAFEPIFNQYALDQSIKIDRIEYMPQKKPNEGLMQYNIYRKKKSSAE